jgi:hypothetical protein
MTPPLSFTDAQFEATLVAIAALAMRRAPSRVSIGRRTATGPILAIDECQRLQLASRTMKHGAVSSTDQGAGSGARKI